MLGKRLRGSDHSSQHIPKPHVQPVSWKDNTNTEHMKQKPNTKLQYYNKINMIRMKSIEQSRKYTSATKHSCDQLV